MARRESTETRVWKHFVILGHDDCWLWMAALTSIGYGKLGFRGKTARAHRVAWILTNGPIPDGKHVLHNCDVRYPIGDITYRRCGNPNHLRLGTNQENVSDRVSKGRQGTAKGEANPGAKLTDTLVVAIRSSSESHKKWARRLGVSPSVIWLARKRRSWKHVA